MNDCNCPYHRFAREQVAKDDPKKDHETQEGPRKLDQPEEDHEGDLGLG